MLRAPYSTVGHLHYAVMYQLPVCAHTATHFYRVSTQHLPPLSSLLNNWNHITWQPWVLWWRAMSSQWPVSTGLSSPIHSCFYRQLILPLLCSPLVRCCQNQQNFTVMYKQILYCETSHVYVRWRTLAKRRAAKNNQELLLCKTSLFNTGSRS